VFGFPFGMLKAIVWEKAFGQTMVWIFSKGDSNMIGIAGKD
jgi:hypothetical protein